MFEASLPCLIIRSAVIAVNFFLVRFQVLTAASMKIITFWDIPPVVSLEYADVSEMRTAIIVLVMEAVRTSETSL
jgi:hypothetical protein